MKICFIYSGLCRTLLHSIKLLNEQITNDTIVYDIYVHIELHENDTKYINKKFDIEELYKLKNVKSILIDDKPALPEIFTDEYQISMYYQWYKIHRIFSVIDCITQYDYIVRIRSDFFILENMNNILLHLKKGVLYIPMGNDYYNSSICNNLYINDQFAIGTPDIMKIYTSVIENIHDYIDTKTCSEMALLKHLQRHNILIERFTLQYKLVLSLCNVIGISGNSGSGKTTISKLIQSIFKFDRTILLETDRYHKWERGHEEWKHKTHLNPDSNYLEKLHKDTFNLKIGNDVFAVDYDHSTGKFTQLEKLESRENIIICGLHTLYQNKIRDIVDLKVFVDTQECLQVYWKLKRDVTERYHNIESATKAIYNRKSDYLSYIYPQKECSDIIVQFYTNDILNTLNPDFTVCPTILLNIYLSINIYNIIKYHISFLNQYIDICVQNDYILLKTKRNIIKEEIYDYTMQLNLQFLNKNDIHDGHNGLIQLIFILILYR